MGFGENRHCETMRREIIGPVNRINDFWNEEVSWRVFDVRFNEQNLNKSCGCLHMTGVGRTEL